MEIKKFKCTSQDGLDKHFNVDDIYIKVNDVLYDKLGLEWSEEELEISARGEFRNSRYVTFEEVENG